MRSASRPSIGDSGRGQALVEFALVFPLFLLLLFGLIEVGRFVYVNNAFNEAAREAARFGSVEQWRYACPKDAKSLTRRSCTEQVARDRMAGAPAAFQVVAECSTSECRANDLLTVTIFTNASGPDAYRFLTPIVGQLIGAPVVSGQAQVVVQ
jgi:Flp pilus assembly protein TadG